MIASSLCLLHCVATPFLFLAHAESHSAESENPFWWKSMDYIFLGLSFIAIYWTTKHTTKPVVKYMFWILWSLLFICIMNEKLELIHLGEGVIYVIAISLVGLHFYNQKYCRCDNEECNKN
ncbi:MerC family mercury resistance protein [Aquimarina litoralis]|nr:MerC family mercury resistance protein [Aquimarina litoralis]